MTDEVRNMIMAQARKDLLNKQAESKRLEAEAEGLQQLLDAYQDVLEETERLKEENARMKERISSFEKQPIHADYHIDGNYIAQQYVQPEPPKPEVLPIDEPQIISLTDYVKRD